VYLLDSNVLLRVAQPGHSLHQEARGCIRVLFRRRETICLAPQILFEFWVVATRPADKNGLGLSIDSVKRKVEKAESFFQLLPDCQPIYREWLRLVAAYSVSGLAAHDARIVAAMKVHNVTDLVTFNGEDFRRFHPREIRLHTPAQILRTFAS
jgi:predicted nucleic acid-binding protein